MGDEDIPTKRMTRQLLDLSQYLTISSGDCPRAVFIPFPRGIFVPFQVLGPTKYFSSFICLLFEFEEK